MKLVKHTPHLVQSTDLVDARYSPLGLHARSVTGPLCPVIAPTSVHSSIAWSSVAGRHLQRLQPPLQPQAMTSFPLSAQRPPTNPPSRCPPTSPNRCLLIQRLVIPFCEPNTDDGDHRITEESVEVDSRVGSANFDEGGRHDRLVIPASWPTRRASKVTVNSCWLVNMLPHTSCT